MKIVRVPCERCGNTVSRDSKLCPYCGSRSPNRWRNILFLCGAAILIAIFVWRPHGGQPSTSNGGRALASTESGSTASFDCRRARTPGQRLICSSSELQRLDGETAARFRASMAAARPADRRRLAQRERRFVQQRETCARNSGSVACVTRSYRDELAWLDTL